MLMVLELQYAQAKTRMVSPGLLCLLHVSAFLTRAVHHLNMKGVFILFSNYITCRWFSWNCSRHMTATASRHFGFSLVLHDGDYLKTEQLSKQSEVGHLHWWQAHYEELKADCDTAEHQAGEMARQLSRNERQLKESQDALTNSAHEVCHESDQTPPFVNSSVC